MTSSAGENKFYLPSHSVDPAFREPYIRSGYRQSGISFNDCLKSIFLPCNETFNVWSSALFAVYFSIKFWNILANEFDVKDAFYWPLLMYMAGILVFNILSAAAHAFNSISYFWRRKCFFLDYAGVSIYSYSMCQAMYCYTRPVQVGEKICAVITSMFLVLALINSICCTYFGCAVSSSQSKLQYFVRTFMYTTALLLSSVPFLYRLVLSCSGVDYAVAMLPMYSVIVLFLLLAAVFYVTKIPERWISETFDLLGHSHNIFHVFASLAVDINFRFVRMEIRNRGMSLRKHPIGCPAYVCVVLMGLAVVMNLAVCYFVDHNNGRKSAAIVQPVQLDNMSSSHIHDHCVGGDQEKRKVE